MDVTFFALLGEVEEDLQSQDSQVLMGRLRETAALLNDQFQGAWKAPLSVSRTFPEFGGVLMTTGPLYEITRNLADASRPLPVRIGLAKGGITAGVDTRDSETMDGPAFDRAGELLYRARKERRMLLVDTGDEEKDTLLNALMLLLQRSFQQWTDRQWEVVRLYRELKRQREVASRLNISQQSVSNSLSGAGWKVVSEVEASLTRALGAEDWIAAPLA